MIAVAVVVAVVAAAMTGRCSRLDGQSRRLAQLGAARTPRWRGDERANDQARRAERISVFKALRTRRTRRPRRAGRAGSSSSPTSPRGEDRQEWASLRTWVEMLCERLPHLHHHVIPAAGSSTSVMSKPRSAPRRGASQPRRNRSWHRRDRLGPGPSSSLKPVCRTGPATSPPAPPTDRRTRQSQPIDPTEWEQFVTEDATRHDHHAIASALDGEGR